MTDELHIPPECYTVKPYFPKCPDAALIQQIKHFIAKTGQPHNWPGHTHTKPEKGSRIEYLEEFDLPEEYQKSKDNWAPCPCCSPNHPKYYNGKIAWFPDDAVIRNMGPDCFAALDKEGHLRAVKKLREQQELAKSVGYLLSTLPKVPAALRTLDHALPTVQAFDLIRRTLRQELPQILKADLWTHIKDGTLNLKNPAQSDIYATINGHTLLDPNEPPLSPRLKTSIELLRALPVGDDHKTIIADMSADDRKETARQLGRGLKNGKEILLHVEHARQFVSPVAIATLRNWGRQDGCPIRIYAMLDDRNLLIGRKEHQYRRFEIPPEFFNVLGTLPNLTSIEIAA